MKSIALTILCLFLTGWSSTAFQTPLPRSSSKSTTALNVFGSKKTKAQQAADAEKYWQGDWVCKDCGYIYNRVSKVVTGSYFTGSRTGSSLTNIHA